MENGANKFEGINVKKQSIKNYFFEKIDSKCSREGDSEKIDHSLSIIQALVLNYIRNGNIQSPTSHLTDIFHHIPYQDLLNYDLSANGFTEFTETFFRYVQGEIEKGKTLVEIEKEQNSLDSIYSNSTKEELAEALEEDVQESINRFIQVLKDAIINLEDSQKTINDFMKRLNEDKYDSSIIIKMIENEEETLQELKDTARHAIIQIKKIVKRELEKTKEFKPTKDTIVTVRYAEGLIGINLEDIYIKKILQKCRTESEKKSAITSIGYIINRINKVKRESMTIEEKIQKILEQTNLINKEFTGSNKQIFELLKEFITEKCKEEEEKLKELGDEISEEIDKGTKNDIMHKLSIPVKQARNAAKNRIGNLKITSKFMDRLIELRATILTAIAEGYDLIIFKTLYIKPILEELKIPEIHYRSFMTIVDKYYEEQKAILMKVTRQELYLKSQLTVARIELRKALKACNGNKTYQEECKEYITHFRMNFLIPLYNEKKGDKVDEVLKGGSYTTTKSLGRRSGQNIFKKDMQKFKEEKEKNTSPLYALHPFLNKNKNEKGEEKDPLKDIKKALDSFLIPNNIKEHLLAFSENHYHYIKSLITSSEITTDRIFQEIME